MWTAAPAGYENILSLITTTVYLAFFHVPGAVHYLFEFP